MSIGGDVVGKERGEVSTYEDGGWHYPKVPKSRPCARRPSPLGGPFGTMSYCRKVYLLILVLASCSGMALAQVGADEDEATTATTESPSVITTTTQISEAETPTQMPASPTMAPVSTSPTLSPSTRPSVAVSSTPSVTESAEPSVSRMPSASPTSSHQPTQVPSQGPTYSPTFSSQPTQQPSLSLVPSTMPSMVPSNSPIISPSQAPSLVDILSYVREYEQRLRVTVPQSLGETQSGVLQYLYEQYTDRFGYFVGTPNILTECIITRQEIGIQSSTPITRARARRWIDPVSIGRGSSYNDTSSDTHNLRPHQIAKPGGENEHSGELIKRGVFKRRRRLQELASYPLKLSFTMRYSTKIGAYDISTYNLKFQQWMNQNLVNNTQDLARLGIPVIESQPVIMLEERDPTPPPSLSPTISRPPTLRPVTQGPTMAPTTDSPSLSPTTASPSNFPSSSPSENPSGTQPIRVDPNNESFVLGLSLGLAGAFMVAVVAFMYFRNMEHKERHNNTQTSQVELAASGQVGHSGSDLGGNGLIATGSGLEHGSVNYAKGPSMDQINDQPNTTMDLTPNDHDLEGDMKMGVPGNADSIFSSSEREIYHSGKPQSQPYDAELGGPRGPPQLQQVDSDTFNSIFASSNQNFPHSQQSQNFSQSQQQVPPPPGQNFSSPPDRPEATSPEEEVITPNYNNLFNLPYGADSNMAFDNNLLMNDNSFSSGSDEYYPGKLDGSQDELDNYKNQDLEALRSGVESAVVGVEGMLSIAIAKALTEPDETDMPWEMGEGDANDANGIIEASCLCETYDWLKRVDRTNLTVDSAHEYLQDVLNRIVITVVYGMTNPMQGVHIVHSCATILGLDLTKELPPTTLVITGMRKTNDLEQGHKYIIKAFKPFGKIEEAAISPNNRGFGECRSTYLLRSLLRVFSRFSHDAFYQDL